LDILGALGKARYYTTVDLTSRFYQIPLREEDPQTTAFSMPGEHFKFCNMSMGSTPHISATNEYCFKWTSRYQGINLFRRYFNLVKKKKGKYLKWISSKDPQDRIEFRRVQGKIRKMITEAKNKSWEKTCSTVESYLDGKRSTEAWRIPNNLRKNENGGQCFNSIPIGNWETYFKGLLTENRERYMGE